MAILVIAAYSVLGGLSRRRAALCYCWWDYTTALNGLRIIQNAIPGLAMKKLGLTEPWYLDKRTSGRDPEFKSIEALVQVDWLVRR